MCASFLTFSAHLGHFLPFWPNTNKIMPDKSGEIIKEIKNQAIPLRSNRRASKIMASENTNHIRTANILTLLFSLQMILLLISSFQVKIVRIGSRAARLKSGAALEAAIEAAAKGADRPPGEGQIKLEPRPVTLPGQYRR
jgi:hypothetical protein